MHHGHSALLRGHYVLSNKVLLVIIKIIISKSRSQKVAILVAFNRSTI